jgi:hypothetical protein
LWKSGHLWPRQFELDDVGFSHCWPLGVALSLIRDAAKEPLFHELSNSRHEPQ